MLRLRTSVYTRGGKRLVTRCDSGERRWTAARASSPAPPPPAGAPTQPSEPQQPPAPVPGRWSLTMTSDQGDYIGGGQSWNHGPPEPIRVTNGTLRTFKVRFEQHCEHMTPVLRGTFKFHAA